MEHCALAADHQAREAEAKRPLQFEDGDLLCGYKTPILPAATSASMMVGRFVFALGMTGITDASATNRLSMPRTRNDSSTTDIGSPGLPMSQVPAG